MKKTRVSVVRIVALAVLALVMSTTSIFAKTDIGLEPGQQMPDFSVPLTDGSTAALSEILKEKDLVVLNIFASWCGPCEIEFPEMERVYQINKDRMEIISVSGDPNDTMDIISEYKESHGLSFPMGLAEDQLGFINILGFPTTVMIDRNGMVGFVKLGAFVQENEFEERVNGFLSPDYNGEPVESEIAKDYSLYIFGYILIGCLLTVIGRWGILKKAGKSGWHSLIPVLSSYKEYSVCWKGWIGIIAALCPVAAFVTNYLTSSLKINPALGSVFYCLGFVLSIFEGLKLADVFGKSRLWGVLLFIPGVKQICRVILAVGKAEYRQS